MSNDVRSAATSIHVTTLVISPSALGYINLRAAWQLHQCWNLWHWRVQSGVRRFTPGRNCFVAISASLAHFRVRGHPFSVWHDAWRNSLGARLQAYVCRRTLAALVLQNLALTASVRRILPTNAVACW